MAFIILDCPHCGTKKMKFDVPMITKTLQRPGWRQPGDCSVFACVAICNAEACRRPVAINITTTEENLVYRWPEGQTGPLNRDLTELAEFLEMWPRPSGPDVPAGMPDDVAHAMTEAETARMAGALGLAISGYRRVIDIATADMDPENAPTKGHEWLANRLRRLAASGHLTTDLADWCKDICDTGSEHTHRPQRPTVQDASEWAELTKLVLTYLYALPKRVRDARAVAKSMPVQLPGPQ